MDIVLNIARDFSSTPGARFKSDGDFSGEEFREKFLEPRFRDLKDESTITINLDGAEGYATSFLEEAFGGLSRKYGIERCLRRLRFVSNEDPTLVREITGYIEQCGDK